MSKCSTALVVALCLATQLVPGLRLEAQEPPAPGQLDLTVMVISDDLSLKPVPKWRFLISEVGRPEVAIEATTGFDGKASVNLRPGKYMLKSRDALEFENELLSWKGTFQIESGKKFVLELSNDNALVEILTSKAVDVPLDEGDLYHAVKASVFKVIAESGSGSGFLVDPRGLIVTNHHVAGASDYLAVQVERGRKYPAKLIVQDEFNDIVVLQINPEIVNELVPLEIADRDPGAAPASIGERVVAIGSPLSTDTILTSGLVSKVEEGVIYSDVNINQGNSGGPLFNMRKQVIGINTFGVIGDYGPGLAGIVRGYLANNLLESIDPELLLDPPPVRELAVASDFRFPPQQLRDMALSMKLNRKMYHVEAGKFDVQIVTPVLIACLEVESERDAAEFRKKKSKKKKQKVEEYKPGMSFYEWRRYSARKDYEPVVVLQAVPEITMTTGSKVAAGLMAFGGYSTSNTQFRYKFKADFDRMELIRSGSVVEPIHPGRAPQVEDTETVNVKLEDIGYWGRYTYPPEAFRPDTTLTLRIWKQGHPEPIEKIFPPQKQQQIWADFAPYFEALEEAARKGP